MPDSPSPHQPSRQQVERWFIRRGLPHFIEDYSASEDIFTRASPFLALVLFTQIFLLFDPKVSGWAQLGVFLLGIAVVLGAFALVNKLRGRRWFALPTDIGWPELTAFVLVPPVLRFIASRDPHDLWFWTVVNLIILGLTYVVTSYALLPMLWWTLRHLWHQIGQLVQLVLKSLPLLLLFSAFLFLNAEIWQVATDIPNVFVVVVVVGFIAVGSGFILLALRKSLDHLNRFDSWAEVDELCASSPYAEVPAPTSTEPVAPPPLGRRGQFNLGLLLFVAQAIQVLLVAATIGVFYVVFGLFTVREATIVQWTTLDQVDVWWRASPFGHEIVLTRPLVVVATLIASFAGLQFAVSALIDDNYRRDFREEITREMRESLAVRTRYVRDLISASSDSV